MADNLLCYGDNLDVLSEIPAEAVDLVYLDPPFNSNRSYNVLFHSKGGAESAAQMQAFDDTWHWSQHAEAEFERLMGGGTPPLVADALNALRKLLGPGDMLAYLVMMAPRLVALRRVLKRTGCLYLHCDPTAGHFLRVLLDAIFGPANFLNEIIWKRTSSHNSAKRYGPIHDVLLFYSKGPKFTWNKILLEHDPQYVETFFRTAEKGGRRYHANVLTGAGIRHGESGRRWRGYDPSAKGRHWALPGKLLQELGVTEGSIHEKLDALDAAGRVYWPDKKGGQPRLKYYADELEGVPCPDVWTDISPISGKTAERLGYPTQKPLALLERIISASSNPGDIVLDPFCGCGTTIDAAQHLGRRWIGIDVTYLAVDLITKRLRHRYGNQVASEFQVTGIPTDIEGARALFEDNKFDFERWAVSIIDALPNEKQVGDRGIDGRVRFHVGKSQIGEALVSVKGGRNLNPGVVRDLIGTISRERAEMGILLTLEKFTRGMQEEAAKSRTYIAPLTRQTYPKVQLLTIEDLLRGKRPQMPPAILPYIKAGQWGGEQLNLLR